MKKEKEKKDQKEIKISKKEPKELAKEKRGREIDTIEVSEKNKDKETSLKT